MTEYEQILVVHKALMEAPVPERDRQMRMSKQAFLELGGTEEAWAKLEAEQTGNALRSDNSDQQAQ